MDTKSVGDLQEPAVSFSSDALPWPTRPLRTLDWRGAHVVSLATSVMRAADSTLDRFFGKVTAPLVCPLLPLSLAIIGVGLGLPTTGG